MSARWWWSIDRFVLPLAAALWLLVDRWGCKNTVYAFVVLFLLLVRMFLSYLEIPVCPALERYKPFQRALAWWHNCDVLGLFLLMCFEVAIAFVAESRAASAIPTVFVGLFVPYVLLIWFARVNLLRARQMVAQTSDWLSEPWNEVQRQVPNTTEV